jgi:hypothetical protein
MNFGAMAGYTESVLVQWLDIPKGSVAVLSSFEKM